MSDSVAVNLGRRPSIAEVDSRRPSVEWSDRRSSGGDPVSRSVNVLEEKIYISSFKEITAITISRLWSVRTRWRTSTATTAPGVSRWSWRTEHQDEIGFQCQ